MALQRDDRQNIVDTPKFSQKVDKFFMKESDSLRVGLLYQQRMWIFLLITSGFFCLERNFKRKLTFCTKNKHLSGHLTISTITSHPRSVSRPAAMPEK